MGWWAVVIATAQAACPPDGVPRAELLAAAERADAAWVALDLEGFARARRGLLDLLPCVADPVRPDDALTVHRVEAFAAFLAGDASATERALASVLAARRDFTFAETTVPIGHPLRDALAAAASRPHGALEPIGATGGTLTVDGRPAGHRPLGRPVVLQHLRPGEDVVATTYLEPTTPRPVWATPPMAAAARPEGARKRPIAVAGAAGGAGLVAGALYGGAWAARARFYDEATPTDELVGLRRRTNTLVLASAGAAALGVGLGAVAVVSW